MSDLDDIHGIGFTHLGTMVCMKPEAAAAMREQLAAKDREIAELQRQLKTWRAAEHAAIRKGEAIKRERDEARESVGRLWREVSAIVKDGDDIGYFSDSLVERLESALAATPEHLRFAEAPVDASRALTS